MKKGLLALIIIGVVALALGSWVINVYNGMISRSEIVSQKWSNVETQYQRRIDLIPNLISAVQGAADFEKSTLTAVTEARNNMASAKSSGDRGAQIEAMNGFDSAISRLLVTVEAYPNIKSTEAFIQFNTELAGTENRIRQARDNYNEVVKDYNLFIKIFPNKLLGGLFGFEEEEFFEAEKGAEVAPDVEFNF
ncbi:LemA family protein [Patescibacteria group bacterium]|nr:LemA family protein [Patescibacteria group bacterium]